MGIERQLLHHIRTEISVHAPGLFAVDKVVDRIIVPAKQIVIPFARVHIRLQAVDSELQLFIRGPEIQRQRPEGTGGVEDVKGKSLRLTKNGVPRGWIEKTLLNMNLNLRFKSLTFFEKNAEMS